MSLSILLVDDHAILRHGLRAVLEAQPEYTIVGEATDGLEAIRLVQRLQPDIVILDLMMPSLNGLEALRIFHKRSPNTRVVVFSGFGSPTLVSEALNCGAQGFVLKGRRIGELLAALRATAAGRHYLSPPLCQQAQEEYLEKGHTTLDPHELLTPRERQVLQLAAEGQTAAEIAARLFISRRTVEMHRANFMKKLGLGNQTDLVLYALRRGILGEFPAGPFADDEPRPSNPR